MKKKNPAIAAVLNFFLPGLGFVYLGSPIFIVTGIALFVCVLLSGSVTGEVAPAELAASVGFLVAFAANSWEVTNLFNAAGASKAMTVGA